MYSPLEHRRVFLLAIHLVALRTLSSTPLLDSNPSLCTFNPSSRTVHQKTPTLPSHIRPLHSAILVLPSSRSQSSPCRFMALARSDSNPAHPPSRIVLTDAPNGRPRTNAHADSYRHVANGHIRPFFGSSISLSILLSSPSIRLRLWPYRDACCPLQQGFYPSSFTRARASTSRAGHPLHSSCSHTNMKHLIIITAKPIPLPTLATLASPTLRISSTGSLDPISEIIFRISLLLSLCACFSICFSSRFPFSLTLEGRPV